MSPVLILSRLCLNRRFQFFGISEMSSESTFRTFLTVSSSMTRRRPALPAFSQGTITVMSLWRILIVRYWRFSPKISLSSFLRTWPAPWCGYTTLSPISKSMHSGSMTRSSICSSVTSGMVPPRSAPATSSRGRLCLQVAVHEIDLLKPAKALADVLRPDFPNTVDCLQLAVSGGKEVVEAPELPDDLVDQELRQARNAPEDPIAPRRDGIVQGVELPVVAEQLGETTEVQKILVGQAGEVVEDYGEGLLGMLREVVVDQRRLVRRDADHHLVELH